jgi:NitT/TauT family transport system permease protein
MAVMTVVAESNPSTALQPRQKGGSVLQLVAWRLLLLLLLLGAWEIAARTVVNPFWVSQPSAIGERLWELASSGMLFLHSATTLWQALLGIALGLPIGVGCGVLLNAWPKFAQVVEPFWMSLYSLPRIALAPLFVIWFGIGLLSKVMLVFSLVVFVFILNAQQGLREVDRDLLNLMRTMRASRLYVFRRVQLPAIIPWILAALKINVGLALIGSVLAEMLGANRGLGWYIAYAGGRLDTTGVFAGLVALMVIALLINELIGRFERRLMPYRINV